MRLGSRRWYVGVTSSPASALRAQLIVSPYSRKFGLAEPQYQSGAAVTASRLGLPDLAFASLDDFAKNGAMIANLDHTVPLIADADTGFGGPTSVARMVHTYDAARIAGFHIEDQVIMKRCGHLKGKEVVDRE